MYETQKVEKALLVVVIIEKEKTVWTKEEIAEEFKNLVVSSGLEVEDIIFVKRKEPTPSYYIGKGKLLEIAQVAQEKKVDVVIFNNNLSFTQQRNIEDILGIKTIDRTQLILDIFARHASTQEGALQVELAQLEYLLPRLKGKGIMLSRLGGGIGTRGPGEKKLEIDRRRISDRIHRLKKDLENVRRHRELLRKKRKREGIKICSLVGYTNAGKSTLLNALTQAHQKVSSSLFTTLDPIARTLVLPNNLKVIVTDTVGFIYKLPDNLLEAFYATLEELSYADVLLHVVDASNRNYFKLIEAVDSILKELKLCDKPTILIFNKIDKLDQQDISILKAKYPEGCFISALKKKNIDELLKRIQEILSSDMVKVKIFVPFTSLDIVDWLYNHGRVLNKEYRESGVVVHAQLESPLLFYLKKTGISYEEL